MIDLEEGQLWSGVLMRRGQVWVQALHMKEMGSRRSR
jgi:hypothetical protein